MMRAMARLLNEMVLVGFDWWEVQDRVGYHLRGLFQRMRRMGRPLEG